MEETPSVSIGLPVWNAERFLSPALDSLLGQTFRNIELIISDNASTDRTSAICQARAAADRRIRYCRNQQNEGASRNFNRVFRLARGKYFKWAAADDVCRPTLVERCLEAIEGRPKAVLAYARGGAIGEDGRPAGGVDLGGYQDLTSDDACERIRRLMQLFRHAERRISGWKGLYLFGLIRSDALRRTNLLGSYVGCDSVLLVQLVLLGKFCEVPEQLLFMRRHEESFSWPRAGMEQRQAFFNPETPKPFTMPLCRRYKEFLVSVLRSPIPFRRKFSVLNVVAREALTVRGYLRDELVKGVEYLLRRRPVSG